MRTNQLFKIYCAFFLLPFFLLLVPTQSEARWVYLQKTGGNDSLYKTGVTLAPDFTSTANKITWDDTLTSSGTVANWTSIFKSISDIVNGDSQKNIASVSYKIRISAADSSNPMIVGEQWIDSLNLDLDYLATALQVLSFRDANNITIESDSGKAHLKYIDNYYYGSWLLDSQLYGFYQFDYIEDNGDTTTYLSTKDPLHPSQEYWKIPRVVSGIVTPINDTNTSGGILSINTLLPSPSARFKHMYDWDMKAGMGDMVKFWNCKNVQIRDLDLDGTLSKVKMGGMWGDGGVQIAPRGIMIDGTSNVMIEDVHSHHFPLDGIGVENDTEFSDSIEIINSIFEYNGRQGISWTGGKNLTIKNCDFNHTGRTDVDSFGVFGSPPGAGIDLEAEDAHPLLNGKFIDCRFINNSGAAINHHTEGPHKAINMEFKRCTIHDVDGYGIWFNGYNFLFDSCHIYAPVVHGYNLDSVGGHTQFIDCDFEDKPYMGQAMIGHPLLDILATKPLFKRCTFKMNDAGRQLGFINWFNPNLPLEKKAIIDGCQIIYNNGGSNTSYLSAIFKNKNVIKNTLNATNSGHKITYLRSALIGSDDPCQPSTIELDGQVMFAHEAEDAGYVDTVRIGRKLDGTEGYAQFKIGKDAIALFQNFSRIYVGENALFNIDGDGTLYWGGVYYIDGQFIASKNCYVSTPTGHFYKGIGLGTPLFYVDKTFNRYGTSTNAKWSNYLGYGTGSALYLNWNYWTMYSPLCLQGGSTAVPLAACSPTVYTNVKVGKSLTLLYNHTATCFGVASSIGLKVQIKGGTPSYAYKLDGLAVTASDSFTTTSGIHTLVVTDATCTDTFIINLEKDFEYKILKGCVGGGTGAKVYVNTCSAPTVNGPAAPTSIVYNSGTLGYDISLPIVGMYTVTATGSSGNVSTSIYIGDCSQCLTADSTAQWFKPNDSSSAMFPSGIVTNKPIVLTGTMHINNILYAYNNPKIFFAANSELIIDSNASFVINKSTLQGCNAYWKGITADGQNRIVVVNNLSKVKDMSDGIKIMNNAFLQARNTYFINNANFSILFGNMNDANYKGLVWFNVFESDANFIPFAGATKAQVGIGILNCNYINIGGESIHPYTFVRTSLGNEFKNMHCGIVVGGAGPIATALGSNSNHIGIYNNRFEDIHKTTIGSTENLTGVYTNYKGAGVYINYGGAPSFDAHTTVSYTIHNTPDSLLFYNCDKAIVSVNSNLVDSNLYIKKCIFGVMNNNLMSKKVEVRNNRIDSVYIGVQVVGNYNKYIVDNNDILINPKLTNCAIIYPGVGVDVKQFVSSPASTDIFSVAGNNIKVPFSCGKAISIANANERLLVGNNYIKLNPDILTTGIVLDNSLYGIFASASDGVNYIGNFVDGISDTAMYNKTYTKGIYLDNSKQSKIVCNKVRYTKQGMYAYGNCTTDSTSIRHNKFKYNRNPLYTLDAAQAGTFGQIGSGSDDNGNNWLYNTTDSSWLQNQLFKVWRFSSVNSPDLIFTSTTLLTQAESGSSTGTTDYGVFNNATSYTDSCADPLFLVSPTASSNGSLEVTSNNDDGDDAEDVASNNDEYITNEAVAHWMNMQELYNLLDRNADLRNSSSILSNFYNNYGNGTIGKLYDVELALGVLFDFKGAEEDILSRYNDAMNRNNEIADEEEYVSNERLIYEIAMNMAVKGMDSITQIQRMEIEILAKTCPFIGGKAVYLARTLYAMYNPLQHYNDKLLCIQGSFKNGNENINLDSLYEAQTNEQATRLANQINAQVVKNEQVVKHVLLGKEIELYPNPANNFINISGFNNDGYFTLYDALGKSVFKDKLIKENTTQKIHLPKLSKGVYQYKVILDKEIYTGKLNILQYE